MIKNKVVQAATMKLEIELRCSECNSPLIVNNTWSDIHGLSCYVEPCEECMSRRTQRAPDRLAAWAGGVNFIQCCLAGGGSGSHRRQVTQTVRRFVAQRSKPHGLLCKKSV